MRIRSPGGRYGPRAIASFTPVCARFCGAPRRYGRGTIDPVSALTDLYTIPQEYLDFRDTIRQIAQERIAPRAAEIDEKAEYPHDLRQLLAEQDILGLPFEEEHGGTGTGTLMLNMAVEEIAKADASTALILMIQELGTLPIKLHGSEELKARFLPRCATGEWSPAFALSEAEAGSDPGGCSPPPARTATSG